MPNSANITLTDRQRYWLEQFLACDASSQTTMDYARAHGINVKSQSAN